MKNKAFLTKKNFYIIYRPAPSGQGDTIIDTVLTRDSVNYLVRATVSDLNYLDVAHTCLEVKDYFNVELHLNGAALTSPIVR